MTIENLTQVNLLRNKVAEICDELNTLADDIKENMDIYRREDDNDEDLPPLPEFVVDDEESIQHLKDADAKLHTAMDELYYVSGDMDVFNITHSKKKSKKK